MILIFTLLYTLNEKKKHIINTNIQCHIQCINYLYDSYMHGTQEQYHCISARPGQYIQCIHIYLYRNIIRYRSYYYDQNIVNLDPEYNFTSYEV